MAHLPLKPTCIIAVSAVSQEIRQKIALKKFGHSKKYL